MNNSIKNKQGGFTLIELLIIVAILGSLAATFYRFAHEGIRKGIFNSREAITLKDSRTLFRYLEQDLRHARSLVGSLGEFKSDPTTLIVRALAPSERTLRLSQPFGRPGKSPGQTRHVVIVYRLNEQREIVREKYDNGTRTSSIALLGPIGTFKLDYPSKAVQRAAWVRVRVSRSPDAKTPWSVGVFERVLKVG